MKIQWAILPSPWDTAVTKNFSELGWLTFTSFCEVHISERKRTDQSAAIYYQSYIFDTTISQVKFRSFATEVSLFAIGY